MWVPATALDADLVRHYEAACVLTELAGRTEFDILTPVELDLGDDVVPAQREADTGEGTPPSQVSQATTIPAASQVGTGCVWF